MPQRPASPTAARWRRGALAGVLALAVAALLGLGVGASGAPPDATAPTLTLPGNLTREATGPDGAAVTFGATARDDVDGEVRVGCDPGTRSTFPLGTTTVTCSAADGAGNVAAGSFTVTVADTIEPLLSLPGAVVAEATGPEGAYVSYEASAGDDVSGEVPVTCAPAPGPFPFGATRVDCSASDAAGNATAGSFTVNVRDTTPPLVDIPADIHLLATRPDGAAVTYVVSATDDVDGNLAAACSPASGSVFPLGVTTVTCDAGDAAGNRSARSFTVIVSPPDTTPPLIEVPNEVVAEANGPGGAVAAYLVTADDDVDGPVQVSCSPPSRTNFPIGPSTVSCTASDRAGNAATRTFVVRVRDATPPLIELPTDLVVEATGPAGATVSYLGSATDDVDGAVPVSCSIHSGATFALGATTVSCAVTDAAGNAATRTLTVTVRDTTPPAVTVPPDFSVPAQSNAGTPVKFAASAVDAVSGPVVVSCAPSSGTTFPPGTTQVRCLASDQAGNSAGTSFAVTVGAPPATS